MNQMIALKFDTARRFELTMCPRPIVENSDDVIISIEATGICGTDLNIFKGNFFAQSGVILGHESVGTVVDKGSLVTKLKIGDRVFIDPTMWCGQCDRCRQGRFNFCLNKKGREVGIDYDGAFAELIKMPKDFVYKIPDEMSWERAVLIEPLACVLNNFENGQINLNDDVLIFGGGPIGALAGLLAEKLARSSLVYDSSTYRVNFLKNLGLNAFQIQEDKKTLDYFYHITNSLMPNMPNVIIDTTGVLCNEAIQIIQQGGRVILMSFNSKCKLNIDTSKIVNNGVKIIGAGDYNLHIQNSISLAGILKTERLISHSFSIYDYENAMSLLTSFNSDISAMKVTLKPKKVYSNDSI